MKTNIQSFSQIILFIFFNLLGNQIRAAEVYKYKTSGNGPDQYKQYSMCRNNSNNGYLFSGTTKNILNQDVIHIIKTDDNFNTVWSYVYYEDPGHTLNSTKIIKNHSESGYWICGYLGDGTTNTSSHWPFVLEIDETGAILQHVIGDFQEGVFLDIEPTSDGGCIAVGFESSSINETELNSGRRGIIVKFSSTLTVSWSKMFISTYTQNNHDNTFFDLAENITVVNSTYTSYQDYYFIMGSVSDEWVGKYGGSTLGSRPNLFFIFLDNSGNLIYKNTILEHGNALDCAYDPADHKFYFVGKLDDNAVPLGIVGKIDASTGTLDYQMQFEGQTGVFPYPHYPVPSKIYLSGDYIYIFGHVRDYMETSNGLTQSDNLLLPFSAKLNKSDASQVAFTLHHIARVNTMGYPSEEPGFLNSWDNSSQTFGNNFPSVYVPEVAEMWLDNDDNLQWGMVNYFNSTTPPTQPIFILHFMSSTSALCDPLSRNLDFDDISGTNISTILDDYEFTVDTRDLNTGNLVMDDDGC